MKRFLVLWLVFLVVSIVAIGVCLGIERWINQPRCPHCGSTQPFIKGRHMFDYSPKCIYEGDVLKCQECGFIIKQIQ